MFWTMFFALLFSNYTEKVIDKLVAEVRERIEKEIRVSLAAAERQTSKEVESENPAS